MLAAEVDRCRTVKKKSINGQDPLAEKPRMTMARFGFHEHLDFRRPRLSRKLRSAMRIHSGLGKPHDQGASLALIATMAFDLFGDSQFQKRVYGALDEALGNVSAHAFDANFADQIPFADGRWWLAGVTHARNDGASFYVLDHGPGVPTVAIAKMRDAIDAYWQRQPEWYKPPSKGLSDKEILLAVAEARRSGIETGSQGRGFEEMIRLIDEWADTGSVQVVSGNATYMFRRNRPGANSLGRCLPLASDFPGTLIVWKVTKPRSAMSARVNGDANDNDANKHGQGFLDESVGPNLRARPPQR